MNSTTPTVPLSPASDAAAESTGYDIPFNRKNRNVYVNINERMIHRRRARISPFDAIVQAGDALWEEMRVYEGKVFKLVDHINRLRRGGELLAYKELPSRPWLIGQIKRTLLDNNMYDGVHIRLIMSRGIKVTAGSDPNLNKYGPTVLVVCEYKDPGEYSLPVKVMTSKYRRPPAECGDPEIRHTGLVPVLLAKAEANANGYEEALLLDTSDKVTETTTSSFFWIKGSTVHTSPKCMGAEAICRDAVLELCKKIGLKCDEKPYTLKDLAKAEEIFLADTLREITPVIDLDGKAIGNGEPGETTTKIAAHFRAFAAEHSTKLISPEDIDFDDDEDEDHHDDD